MKLGELDSHMLKQNKTNKNLVPIFFNYIEKFN